MKLGLYAWSQVPCILVRSTFVDLKAHKSLLEFTRLCQVSTTPSESNAAPSLPNFSSLIRSFLPPHIHVRLNAVADDCFPIRSVFRPEKTVLLQQHLWQYIAHQHFISIFQPGKELHGALELLPSAKSTSNYASALGKCACKGRHCTGST